MLHCEAWKVDAKTAAYFARRKWLQWKTPNRAPIKGEGYKSLITAAFEYPGRLKIIFSINTKEIFEVIVDLSIR